MFSKGRRLFSAASIGLIVGAFLHTLGNLSAAPSNETEAAIIKAMSDYTIPLGLGMAPSFMGIFRSLTFTMSITLLVIGAQNLAAAKHGSNQLLKALTWLNVLGVGALVALYACYRIPPPLITLGVVEVLFVLALFSKGSESVG